MIYSDFLVLSALSIYGPIFALFVIQRIIGGSAQVVGFAAASYWLARSIVQLPISRFLDKYDGEKDDFWAMVIGSILFSAVPILFIFAKLPWHIYLLQAVYGLADSLAVPTYLAIFSHHLDKNKENFEWGLRSVSIGIGAALGGATGGYLADKVGFNIVFILTSIITFIGATILITIRHTLLTKPQPVLPVLTKKNHA
jgi:MFS family permease